MGQEIADSQFQAHDFAAFYQRLKAETRCLEEWLQEEAFDTQNWVCGLELEAWLVDQHHQAAPINKAFLAGLQHPQIVPELAQFNIELNTRPFVLQGQALRQLQVELATLWQHCQQQAARLDSQVLMIGTLPTACEEDFHLRNMSSLQRYYALNEQVLRQREGRSLKLDILGREHLQMQHHSVMLEAATTSVQIHLQVAPHLAKRLYNTCLLLSAPMVGLGANSPFLFGKSLWEDTRIPLFEQAVELGGYADAAQGPLHRVSFGSAYIDESILECFTENMLHYPVLLPTMLDQPIEKLAHLQMHNGTVWRWNRPLVGFSENGQPHLRIEHRVMSSGPSVIDVIANTAVFLGLARRFSDTPPAAHLGLRFAQVRDNFYQAARFGLSARITWLEGQKYTLQQLWEQQLLPAAERGLQLLELDADDIQYYLAIIAARLHNGQNGAVWQRHFVQQHGADMSALTAAYAFNQHSGLPVHAWHI